VLAIPLTVSGEAFPHRDLIIFVASAVVVATLVPPGLTLGPLIERLGLGAGERERAAQDHAEAGASLARAALARLDELAEAEAAPVGSLDRMRSHYDERLRGLEARLNGGSKVEEDLATYARVRQELLAAERGALADLRRGGEIPDRVGRAIERDLDLEEARLPG
jgi:CPA1 family monovalent cation:H+ antiporter